MDIAEEAGDGAVVLSPVGRLDSTHSAEFERVVLAVFDRGEKNLLVDLAEVPYISSRGLRVFLVGARRAADAGGRLAVCSLPEFVRSTFEATGFLNLLAMFDSRTDALASLGVEPAAGDSSAEPR